MKGKWYGCAVLIGPKEDNDNPKTTQGPSRPRTVYQLNGVYVLPDTRRLGVGTAMIGAMLQHGRAAERAGNGDALVFQVRVDSKNAPARKLYENVGFVTSRIESVATKEKEKGGVTMRAQETTVLVMELAEDVCESNLNCVKG